MILFNSLTFLFRFFPVFLAIYYLTPARFREVVLFFGSIVFYAMGAGYMAIMLTVLTIANYILGQMVFYVDKGGVRPQNKRAFIAALILDVGALVVFKALSGITDKVVLPLGFSFYLFKMISYQADLFRGEITRRPEIMDTVVYFTMFPQVTQGPISRWNSIGFEKRDRTVTVKAFNDGLFFFVLGLGMKVLLADPLSILWNEIGKIGYESISTPLAWMGAIGYSLRLYMDFWGYSLMSAGIGMMLGYHFVINFLHPYWACGIGDFYRRWHATLGSWFRDYVYIPLGGNRKGNLRTILNLAVVWLLTGLWHGITPNFLIWSGSPDRMGEICCGRPDLFFPDHRPSSRMAAHPADLGHLRDPGSVGSAQLLYAAVSLLWKRRQCQQRRLHEAADHLLAAPSDQPPFVHAALVPRDRQEPPAPARADRSCDRILDLRVPDRNFGQQSVYVL